MYGEGTVSLEQWLDLEDSGFSYLGIGRIFRKDYWASRYGKKGTAVFESEAGEHCMVYNRGDTAG